MHIRPVNNFRVVNVAMEFIDYDPQYEIKDMHAGLQDNEIALKWYWPQAVDTVYIYKVKSMESEGNKNLNIENMRLCTKLQYESKGGFSEKIYEKDEFLYRIYAALRIDGKWSIINQTNRNNEILVCTGKLDVNVRIEEKKVLFSDLKKIEITLWSENQVKRENLCYVIKRGGYPYSIEDGCTYEFTKSINSSKFPMPDIVIPQNYFLKVFFTNDIASRRYCLKYV